VLRRAAHAVPWRRRECHRHGADVVGHARRRVELGESRGSLPGQRREAPWGLRAGHDQRADVAVPGGVVQLTAKRRQLGDAIREGDRHETIPVRARPLDVVPVLVQQLEDGTGGMGRVVRPVLRRERFRRTHLGEDARVERVVASVMRDLHEAVRAGLLDRAPELFHLVVETGHLGLRKLHVAGEKDPRAAHLELEDEALVVLPRTRARLILPGVRGRPLADDLAVQARLARQVLNVVM
jgi:hypothetical protein